MLTLFKSLVISRLDYASQLWSPHKISQITLIEKVQRSFTKHITGMRDLSYHERLQALRLYSLQRRRERYCIILIWKIIESKAQNLSDPILCNFSDRRGRSCVISHDDMGDLPYPILCNFSDRRGRSCVISHDDMGDLPYLKIRQNSKLETYLLKKQLHINI